MRSGWFAVWCALWLADMVALALIGPLGRHVAAAMALYGCGFLLLWVMWRSFPAHWKTARTVGVVLGLGIAVRAVFLCFPPNTDIYRYIWEGAIQNHGFNPYALPPDDPALAFLAQGDLSRIWPDINHKHLTAVYPPAAMLLFRLFAWVSPTPLFFKAMFLLFDVGLMFYAANPLAIVFISGEGHLDVMQSFFLCLALLRLAKCGGAGGHLALGVAVVCKYVSAVAIPFCRGRRPGWGRLWILAPAALFIPYLSAGAALFAALETFATRMHYNDVVTEVAGMLFGRWSLAAAALILLICLSWVWLAEDDPLRGVYFAVGCLLAMLPTLHPWYLVMIAPFMCFFPSPAWLYLQAAVLFTFPVLGHEFRTGVFQEVSWLKILEYLPFFGLLIWGLFRRSSLARLERYVAPASISVIIPALNEAERIGRLLSDLRERPWIAEVIVADGGSVDGTAAVARRYGARVVAGGRGRGVQIRSAADTARGDVLLILHADSRLGHDVTDRVILALTADRDAAGGCFGMRFRGSGVRQRAVAGLNNLRAIVTGISFGDQAQFVRADALKRIGGFPDLMLMEDVELSLRLKSCGGAVYLGPGVSVSGRRWQAGRFLENLRTVVGLFFRYLLERRLGVRMDAERYYRAYYRDLI